MGDNELRGLRVRIDMTGSKSDRHLDEECDSGDDAVRRVVEFFGRDDEDEYVPMAGADWRVEPADDLGVVRYVVEDNDDEEVVVIPPEHAEAIAVAAGFRR